jgi:hypothetical protein
MKFLLLVTSLASFAVALWLLRVYRWPRIQARVLSTRKEVTGMDEGCEEGSLHAELEYWYDSHKFAVSWQCDLRGAPHLPGALWMAIHPKRPAEPRLLPEWTPAAAWIAAGLFFFYGFAGNG